MLLINSDIFMGCEVKETDGQTTDLHNIVVSFEPQIPECVMDLIAIFLFLFFYVKDEKKVLILS